MTGGDVGLAEEIAQDAFVAALEEWPRTGVPDNPGGWLMTTARNRAIDRLRRAETFERKQEELGHRAEARAADAKTVPEAALSDHMGDDVLKLIFTTCHPVLSRDAQVTLTLKLVGGLTNKEIARAFLAAEPTIAQRVSRAKRTLSEARVPFEVPGPDELDERLGAVLNVVYAVFNEGYAATSGEDWMRMDLTREALRLGRMLQALEPREPEVHGLAALMELTASRMRARTAPDGSPVLLLDQDRSRWDQLLIRRGFEALDRADELGGARGPFTLQAAIAACHARARKAEDTDWERIAATYDALAGVAPSPVVDLNRAVAIGMAYGPEAGLEAVNRISESEALESYHLMSVVRGDLFEKLGRRPEARAEFLRAAQMTDNERERQVLLARAEAL